MESATAKDIRAEIAKGADIEANTINGETPLHAAAKFGNAETVTTMLKAGANGNARNKIGKTPFESADDELRGIDAY